MEEDGVGACVKLAIVSHSLHFLSVEILFAFQNAGVMLNYGQASSGQPRMVFSFDFVSKDQIAENDEG